MVFSELRRSLVQKSMDSVNMSVYDRGTFGARQNQPLKPANPSNVCFLTLSRPYFVRFPEQDASGSWFFFSTLPFTVYPPDFDVEGTSRGAFFAGSPF